MKKKVGLMFKFILGIVFIGVCMTASAVLVGVRLYRESITKQYNQTAYQAAEAAAGYFTREELAEYADLTYRYNTGRASEEEVNRVIRQTRYQEAETLLQNLRKSMQANDIYVCVFDPELLKHYDPDAFERGEWEPIYYIMDSYHKENAQLSFGDSGPILPDFRQDILESFKTGKHADNYFVSEGQFGYNTSAVYPVVYDGETVAFIGVEIPMSTLRSDINYFILRVVLAAGMLALVILLPGIVYLVNTIIHPLKLVVSEAERFVQSNNEISEVLGTIRTNDEIQVLGESILKMEIGINEYIENLKLVTAEKERIGAELDVAAQIQADMLPGIFPPFPDREEFDIYASMTPAKEVGGDFFDFFLMDEDHLALVMADVSGKGVPAALFMVIARTLIKNRVQMGDSPAQALTNVNEQLCEGNEAELFVTVWLAVLELSTGKGIAANAGHEHPALCRAGGSFELVVYRHSPAVAVMEGIRFCEHEFELAPGDRLYVYTDGVLDAVNAREEMFGADRMLRKLNQNPRSSLQELLHMVKEEIDVFTGDVPQFDDITMLCLHYFGKGMTANEETDYTGSHRKSAASV